MIGGWIVKLVKVVASNPWLAAAAAGIGLFAAGALIPKMFPETVDAEERKTEKKVEEQGEDTVRSQLEQQANNPNLWQRLTGESAEAKEQLHKLDTGETKRYAGGGSVFGKKLLGGLGGAGLGSMFGPLGMLLGAGLGSGKIQDWFGGLVSGEKGVDKIPAMLTDGEFVMSKGAVEKYGTGTLEAMNAAGGGTNKPKMVSGTAFAHGGGQVGKGIDYLDQVKPAEKDPIVTKTKDKNDKPLSPEFKKPSRYDFDTWAGYAEALGQWRKRRSNSWHYKSNWKKIYIYRLRT